MNQRHIRFARDDGFAMVSTLLVLVLLMTLGSISLMITTIDLRSSSHFRTGNQAFFSAESGVMHALSAINSRGVQSFQQVAQPEQWNALYGAAAKTMSGYPAYRYTVTVAATNASDGTITSTGGALLQAQRTVRIGVRRAASGGSPGALHLGADDMSSIQFAGNSFSVDGNDNTLLGAPNPSGPVMPGISTRNDGVTGAVTGSLSSGQKDNVTGLGFSSNPLIPSVVTTAGPGLADFDAMAANVLAKAGVVTTSAHGFSGNTAFGTLASPQITYMTDPDVRLNGSATGVGILVVDGSITINGSLDFIGWIIVRGATTINASGSESDSTDVYGNATINGSLWTGSLAIKIGGDAQISYCEACLALVDGIGGGGGGNLARPMTVTSWEEL